MQRATGTRNRNKHYSTNCGSACLARQLQWNPWFVSPVHLFSRVCLYVERKALATLLHSLGLDCISLTRVQFVLAHLYIEQSCHCFCVTPSAKIAEPGMAAKWLWLVWKSLLLHCFWSYFPLNLHFKVMGIPWHPLFSDPNYPKVTLFPYTSGTAASHPSFALAKTVTRQWSPNPHHADTVWVSCETVACTLPLLFVASELQLHPRYSAMGVGSLSIHGDAEKTFTCQKGYILWSSLQPQTASTNTGRFRMLVGCGSMGTPKTDQTWTKICGSMWFPGSFPVGSPSLRPEVYSVATGNHVLLCRWKILPIRPGSHGHDTTWIWVKSHWAITKVTHKNCQSWNSMVLINHHFFWEQSFWRCFDKQHMDTTATFTTRWDISSVMSCALWTVRCFQIPCFIWVYRHFLALLDTKRSFLPSGADILDMQLSNADWPGIISSCIALRLDSSSWTRET